MCSDYREAEPNLEIAEPFENSRGKRIAKLLRSIPIADRNPPACRPASTMRRPERSRRPFDVPNPVTSRVRGFGPIEARTPAMPQECVSKR